MFDYWEVRIYWEQRSGNKKLIKRFRYDNKPDGDEVTRLCTEYAADDVEVVEI